MLISVLHPPPQLHKMATLTTFYTPSQHLTFHPTKPTNYFFNPSLLYNHKSCIQPSSRFRRKPIRISCLGSSLKDCSSSADRHSDTWADSECVQVVGIGSRVDSVLDFCIQSNSSSSSTQPIKFWNIIKRESMRGRLRQRLLGKDNYPNFVEAPLNPESHSKAVVLVASAGYGDDYVLATEILRTARSGSGLVAAVVVKPFSFEGQRRIDEVKKLVDKLQDCVDFCIDIDIDTLLKMDLVTLDEALKTAYRAVSSAISAVSVLVSDTHQKHIHSVRGGMTHISLADVKKALNSYKEARIGFGVGHDVESSIVQAVYDCPFLAMGLKDLDGVILCVVSSSSAVRENDVWTVLHTLREATECTKDVIISVVQNPEIKPKQIASTVITVGNIEGKALHKSTIFSRLADSIPFVFNFLRRHDAQSDNSKEINPRKNIFPIMLEDSVNEKEVPDMIRAEDSTNNFGMYSSENMLVDENWAELEPDNGGAYKAGSLDAAGSPSNYKEPNAEGSRASGRNRLINRDVGPGYSVAQEWDEEELNVTVAHNPKFFQLPVGVRDLGDSHGNFDGRQSRQPAEQIVEEDAIVQPSVVPSVSSLNEFADMGFEVVNDIWSGASSLLKGKQLDVPKKQGGLSARAASMLEAERDSETKWSPMMKIRYRGGVYKGRCHGGLPEGRGRLTFQDGSVYDGMWRYGKRSGLGSLFFSNGDVFHGSWRDDLMHGKGWLYFHTGERWFANFWKGRANGEGRFYSKSGEVFFGNFRDGWRDGRFLCVKVDGRRYVEVWNDGMLMSSDELDS